MNSQANDRMEILMTRHILGEIKKNEESELMQWLLESPDNQAIYDSMKLVFEVSSSHMAGTESPETIDIDYEWSVMRQQISAEEEAKTSNIGAQGRSVSFFWRIAASILVVFLVSYGAYEILQPGSDFILTSEESTLTKVLPDKSTITLNNNSQLTYNKDFNAELREVNLKGEAYFEITPNKTKPFIIHANNTIVRVIGTSFTVRAPEDGAEVEVIVKSGVVTFSSEESGKIVTLKAGNKGHFASGNTDILVSENDNVNFLAWKTRKIIFEETSLPEVADVLSKAYHVQVEIPELANCEVTVTFDSQSIESVMKVLEATLNLTYSINGNKIIISEAGCN